MELLDACASESATTAGKQIKAASTFALAKEQEALRIEEEKAAVKKLGEMDTEVKEAKELYKSTLKAMPTA